MEMRAKIPKNNDGFITNGSLQMVEIETRFYNFVQQWRIQDLTLLGAWTLSTGRGVPVYFFQHFLAIFSIKIWCEMNNERSEGQKKEIYHLRLKRRRSAAVSTR